MRLLSPPKAVEVRTHPVLLTPPISKPTFTVDKWQAISAGQVTQAKTEFMGLQFQFATPRGRTNPDLPKRHIA